LLSLEDYFRLLFGADLTEFTSIWNESMKDVEDKDGR
jgi:hypothetical protein